VYRLGATFARRIVDHAEKIQPCRQVAPVLDPRKFR
jgi:hypothetical protein